MNEVCGTAVDPICQLLLTAWYILAPLSVLSTLLLFLTWTVPAMAAAVRSLRGGDWGLWAATPAVLLWALAWLALSWQDAEQAGQLLVVRAAVIGISLLLLGRYAQLKVGSRHPVDAD